MRSIHPTRRVRPVSLGLCLAALMDPLDLVKLTELMARTSGSPCVTIGLIDGPVLMQHPELAGDVLHEIAVGNGATCRAPTAAPVCTAPSSRASFPQSATLGPGNLPRQVPFWCAPFLPKAQ